MTLSYILTIDTDTNTSTIVPYKNDTIDKKDEDLVKLTNTRLILSKGVLQELSASTGDRIVVNYDLINGICIPVIGVNSSFNLKSGNLLNANNSISFRGAANTALKKYGIHFKHIKGEIEHTCYLYDPDMEDEVLAALKKSKNENYDLTINIPKVNPVSLEVKEMKAKEEAKEIKENTSNKDITNILETELNNILLNGTDEKLKASDFNLD